MLIDWAELSPRTMVMSTSCVKIGLILQQPMHVAIPFGINSDAFEKSKVWRGMDYETRY